jgi:hypothetical protein
MFLKITTALEQELLSASLYRQTLKKYFVISFDLERKSQKVKKLGSPILGM